MQYGDLSQLERAFNLLGVGRKNVEEFHSRNMAHFNEVATDCPGVGYYSFGARQKEMQMSEVLRTGFEIITDHHTPTDCDGLMKTSDTHHGQYLVTFE